MKNQLMVIQHIGFATKLLDLAGLDQDQFKAATLKHFEQWYPINACGLHCDSFDATFRRPIGNRIEICGEGSEATHGVLRVTIFRYSHKVDVRRDVDSRRVGVDLLER